MGDKLATCEACGADHEFGTPTKGVRFKCGSFRLGKSGIVRSRNCLYNEIVELRDFKRLVKAADRKATVTETALAIRELCQ